MPGANEFAVQYQLTGQDFDRLYRSRRLPDHPTFGHLTVHHCEHKPLASILMAFGVAVGGVAMLVATVLGHVTSHGPWIILPILVVGEVAVWGIHRLFRWLVTRAWRAAGFFDERRVVLTADGVVVDEAHSCERRFPWHTIRRVEVDHGDVALALSPRPPAEWPAMSTLFIPNHAFAQPDEAEAFAQAAENQRVAAAGRNPQPTPEDPRAERLAVGELEVRSQLTNADFDRLYERSWTRPCYQSVRWSLAAVLGLELVAVTIFVPPDNLVEWLQALGFGALLALQYGLLLRMYRWWTRHNWAKVGLFEEQTVGLSASGVSVHSPRRGDWRICWNAVERTSLDPGGVVVAVRSRRIPLVIPRSAFSSLASAESFVLAAEQWRVARLAKDGGSSASLAA